MNWWQTLFGAVGVVATVFGFGVLFAPDLFASGPVEMVTDGITEIGTDSVFLAAGAGLILFLGFALRSPGVTDEETPQQFERFLDREPTDEQLTASAITQEIETAVEDGGEALITVREELRIAATSVYADITNVPEESAREAIDRGTWCEDRVATAFLAGPDGPSRSLEARLRLLVVPGRERRRQIERTITAIESLEYT